MTQSDLLAGRTALVTGGSRGLGRSIATALCRAGAHVAIVARPSTDLAEAVADLRLSRLRDSQRVTALEADLRTVDLAGLATSLVLAAGTVDILVNNAAIIGPIGPLDRTEDRDWAETIHVNLLAPIALMRAALPGMRERRHGKVVNISGGGATGSRPNFTAYACAKTALVRATEIVSDEVKDLGIDINAVAPGAMNTRLFDQVLAAGAESVGAVEFERAMKQQQEGGAPPSLAADLVVWLTSSASNGISGRVLSAIWDPWESLASHRDELARSDVYTLRRIVPHDRGKDWAKSL